MVVPFISSFNFPVWPLEKIDGSWEVTADSLLLKHEIAMISYAFHTMCRIYPRDQGRNVGATPTAKFRNSSHTLRNEGDNCRGPTVSWTCQNSAYYLAPIGPHSEGV